MNQDDRAFETFARQQLNRHAGAIDEVTAGRLRAARRQALARASTPATPWIPLAAAASVLVVALGLALWQGDRLPDAGPPTDGWDVMADSRDLELVEELEFYQWLDSLEQSSLPPPASLS